MNEIPRRWRVLAGGAAAGVAAVVGFAGPTASAEPVLPQPPLPAPATVSQVAPPAATGLNGVMPATGAAPAGVLTPAVPAPPQATITPAASGTLADFFKAKGVRMEPQNSRDFKALTIVLPMPKGWSQVPDPNVPDAFAVIADRVGGNGLYSSNAQVVVYKLVGDFDPKEAISHGFVDSQQLTAWRATDGSLADFGGMPSTVIEGTYRENSMTLNASRRHVIATAGPEKYLVTLSVITSIDQVVAAADATDAIVNGFKVSLPGAATQAPPTPTPGLPQSPGQPAVPQLLGQPG
ncbi:MAG TPA: LpqN/LpqT family lipoprotein [Mycobacterium sp.]|nr:LpqN/LpqT family lipoprotein [Mycobacterium sp.]